jgi:anti-anti-sigma factor
MKLALRDDLKVDANAVVAQTGPAQHAGSGGHEEFGTRYAGMGLQILIRDSGEVTILDLRGTSTLDSGGSELLRGQMQRLSDHGACNLLLNVEGLTQVDSSGISVLVETYVFLRRNGGNLKLLRPRDRVSMVLKLFRLLDIIPNFESEALALASFPQNPERL